MNEDGLITVPDDLSQGYSDVIVVSIVIPIGIADA